MVNLILELNIRPQFINKVTRPLAFAEVDADAVYTLLMFATSKKKSAGPVGIPPKLLGKNAKTITIA